MVGTSAFRPEVSRGSLPRCGARRAVGTRLLKIFRTKCQLSELTTSSSQTEIGARAEERPGSVGRHEELHQHVRGPPQRRQAGSLVLHLLLLVRLNRPRRRGSGDQGEHRSTRRPRGARREGHVARASECAGGVGSTRRGLIFFGVKVFFVVGAVSVPRTRGGGHSTGRWTGRIETHPRGWDLRRPRRPGRWRPEASRLSRDRRETGSRKRRAQTRTR